MHGARSSKTSHDYIRRIAVRKTRSALSSPANTPPRPAWLLLIFCNADNDEQIRGVDVAGFALLRH